MRFGKSLYVLIILMLTDILMPGTALADVLVMKNGDRITVIGDPAAMRNFRASFLAPKKKPTLNSLDEVDPELLKTYEKLGIPLQEQEILAGVAVDHLTGAWLLEHVGEPGVPTPRPLTA